METFWRCIRCGETKISRFSHKLKKRMDNSFQIGYEARCRDVAQLGRALRSGRRSRAFKSRHPDHFLFLFRKTCAASFQPVPEIVFPVYPAAAAILKMGRYMAMIIPPTTPPRNTIMKGSSSAVMASDRRIHLIVIEIGDLG